MNLGEIIKRVQRQFGDESEAQITRDDIIRWANDGQLDIAKKTACLQQHATTNAIQEDGSYVVPDDFLAAQKVSYNGQKLVGVSLEELDKTYPTTPRGTGTPTHYYVWGRNLWLHPEPNQSGDNNLSLFYTKLPATLSQNSDVPEIPVWMHPSIVRYCVAMAKELDETLDQAQAIMAEYELQLIKNRDTAQSPISESYPSVRPIPGDD